MPSDPLSRMCAGDFIDKRIKTSVDLKFSWEWKRRRGEYLKFFFVSRLRLHLQSFLQVCRLQNFRVRNFSYQDEDWMTTTAKTTMMSSWAFSSRLFGCSDKTEKDYCAQTCDLNLRNVLFKHIGWVCFDEDLCQWSILLTDIATLKHSVFFLQCQMRCCCGKLESPVQRSFIGISARNKTARFVC